MNEELQQLAKRYVDADGPWLDGILIWSDAYEKISGCRVGSDSGLTQEWFAVSAAKYGPHLFPDLSDNATRGAILGWVETTAKARHERVEASTAFRVLGVYGFTSIEFARALIEAVEAIQKGKG